MRCSGWKSKSSYPSTPTLTPSPHQVLFIKTTERPSLKGSRDPPAKEAGLLAQDEAANGPQASRRRFPLVCVCASGLWAGGARGGAVPWRRREGGGRGRLGAGRLAGGQVRRASAEASRQRLTPGCWAERGRPSVTRPAGPLRCSQALAFW